MVMNPFLIILSTTSSVTSWIVLEYCTIAFVALSLSAESSPSEWSKKEKMFKFFVVQSISSMIILWALFGLNHSQNYESYALFFCFMLKAALSPFFGWGYDVIMAVPSICQVLFLTIFKSPILVFPIMNTEAFVVLSLMNVVFGSLKMVSEKSVLGLMFWSSLYSFGWIMVSCKSSFECGLIFFSLYCFTVTLSLWSFENVSKKAGTIFMASIMGLPPFFLFNLKFGIFSSMMNTQGKLIQIFLSIFTYMAMFGYYKFMNQSFLVYSKEYEKEKKIPFMIFVLVVTTFLSI